VDQRVAHQVADHLAEPDLVAEHDQRGARPDRQVDAPPRGHHPRIVYRVGGERE